MHDYELKKGKNTQKNPANWRADFHLLIINTSLWQCLQSYTVASQSKSKSRGSIKVSRTSISFLQIGQFIYSPHVHY